MSDHTKLDCEEAFKRLGDFLDHELSEDEIEQVQGHIDFCSHCAMEFRFEEKLLIELKAKARNAPAPDSLRESVLKALDQAQAEED
ncbi:MAG: mycothiol system anti-sigma-R factor [Armatimonadetes bacterium 55-13]|nr:mycothiol system anti-sigma-R factor [Armatimonadota bacterium]OJU62106.1 MAG: mycothiol system anti-sigma-R factor [Armatimonadetes bacterium 55-13]